ncbi:hypothetical protein D7X33_23990 [Butyricicoccus sp. 1XD8-22]|nr:hypothetical protein D7X33_23990 [Butyricicoccus sp. 1XD8-22]
MSATFIRSSASRSPRTAKKSPRPAQTSKGERWKIDARGNAGYGFWQMAYGSDGKSA